MTGKICSLASFFSLACLPRVRGGLCSAPVYCNTFYLLARAHWQMFHIHMYGPRAVVAVVQCSAGNVLLYLVITLYPLVSRAQKDPGRCLWCPLLSMCSPD